MDASDHSDCIGLLSRILSSHARLKIFDNVDMIRLIDAGESYQQDAYKPSKSKRRIARFTMFGS